MLAALTRRRWTSRLLRALPLALLLAPAAGAVAAEPEGYWALCGNALRLPERPTFEGDPDAGDAVQVAADQANLVEGGVSTLYGNVQVVRGTRQMHSDVLVHDEPAQVLDATGNVRIWDEGLHVTGSHARMEMATNQSLIEDASYLFMDAHGRGTADSALLLRDRDLAKIRNGTFTTCNPGKPAWELKARKVHLDRAADVGTARDAWLRLGGIPVFYSPYLSFPLSNARKSGFLAPRMRVSGDAGAEITVPYYFNLAPNYDATLGVRAMADRGAQVQGEFRYLTDRGSGEANVEYMVHDQDRDDYRALLHFQHRGDVTDRLRAFANVDWVSDPLYFEDLGTSLDISSRTFLERRGDLVYSGDRWWALARAQSWQSVDDTLPAASRPYKRMPQLMFATSRPEHSGRLNYGLQVEAVRFDRDASVTGTRLDLKPTISFPLRHPGAFVVPAVSYRLTRYALSGTAPGTDDSPGRAIPTLSVDGGLVFERALRLGSRDLTHTIEPRAFYLLTPGHNQDDLPVFDSGEFSFNFAQLFRDNRFASADRVGDANQVSLSLTSRVLGAGGEEIFRAAVGQIRYLSDRDITISPGGARDTRSASDIVAELGLNQDGRIRASGGLQWDTREDRSNKAVANVRVQPDSRRVLNLGYRFVRDTAEQVDLSVAWPVRRNLRLIGRWNYALPEAQVLETVMGFEYESCCWGLRAAFQSHLNETGGGQTNAVYLQLQLKGLAGVGEQALDFLRRSVPGYRREF